MACSFLVTFSECRVTRFPSRIEVDDRTEAYLRVLQQKVTSDTQIVSSPSVRRQLSWSDLFTEGPLEILELEFIFQVLQSSFQTGHRTDWPPWYGSGAAAGRGCVCWGRRRALHRATRPGKMVLP